MGGKKAAGHRTMATIHDEYTSFYWLEVLSS